MTKKIILSLMIGGAALSLSACAKTAEQFDFSKKAPDEFAVVTRAPLEMPPSFNQVPPPRPGAQRPQELSADQLAKQSILGPDAMKKIAKENGVSQGEAVLLQKTGGSKASPAIRNVVNQETAEIIKDDTPGIDTMKKWVGQKVEEPASVVDPVAETNRLKANKAQGKPVTTGKTPTIEE